MINVSNLSFRFFSKQRAERRLLIHRLKIFEKSVFSQEALSIYIDKFCGSISLAILEKSEYC